MSVPLYDLTVPVFLRGLGTLEHLLEKGQAHAETERRPIEALLGARLAPDMLTLTGQVQRASDTARLAAVRIGGVENRSFPDEERTLEEVQARIAGTRAWLEAVPRSAIDGRAGETLTVNLGRKPLVIGAADYALKWALPNFFFHVTTAYDILRHEGVSLAKPDFIGALP